MKANSRANRWRALVLLPGACAMVMETSCSHAPTPQVSAQPVSSPSEIRARLALYADDKATIRIHTVDGTIIPTAHYALTDSAVVVSDVLRGKDFIPELSEAHLYRDRPTVKELPVNVALPVAIPMDQISALQGWNLYSGAIGAAVGPRLAVLAEEKMVARIRAADGTIIPTSHYAVNDSVVVISNVLRGNEYVQEEPRLYGESTVKTLPKDVTLPLTIPLSGVAQVDPWQDPHVNEKGIKSAVVIFGVVALVVALASAALESMTFNTGAWYAH